MSGVDPVPSPPQVVDVDADPVTRDFCELLERAIARSGAVAATTSFHPHLGGRQPIILGIAGARFAAPAMIAAAARHLEIFARRYGSPTAASSVRYAPPRGASYDISCRVLAVEEQGCLVRSSLFEGGATAEHIACRDTASADAAAGAFFRLWLRCRALELRAAGLAAALDTCGSALFVLDAERTLLFANRQALAILDSRDGLRRAGTSIAATSLAEATRFQICLHQAADADGRERPEAGPVSIQLPRRGRRPLVATLTSLGPDVEAGAPAMTLQVVDPELDLRPLLHPVCKLFQLSPVEARLAVLLATGIALGDAAEAMRIKELTARSYLKQIFLKTETRRQCDLVRVMMSSIVPMSSGPSKPDGAARLVSAAPLHLSSHQAHSG